MDIIDAKPTCENCHDTAPSRCDACWRRTVAELQADRDRAQRGYEGEHLLRLEAEQQRDTARRHLYRLEEENRRLRGKYAEQRRQAEDWEAECHNARHDRDTARGALKTALADYDSACAERDAARAAADDWAALARMPCHEPGEPCIDMPQCHGKRPRQYGPATFVMRRCKLAEGHDGQCEPA